MPYTLHKLAPGSYDLKLDGDLIGGVVKNGPRAATWAAEMVGDLPSEALPAPFMKTGPTFPTLDAVFTWLEDEEIQEDS